MKWGTYRERKNYSLNSACKGYNIKSLNCMPSSHSINILSQSNANHFQLLNKLLLNFLAVQGLHNSYMHHVCVFIPYLQWSSSFFNLVNGSPSTKLSVSSFYVIYFSFFPLFSCFFLCCALLFSRLLFRFGFCFCFCFSFRQNGREKG